NRLMQRRAIGPAIVKDMIRYIGDRHRRAPGAHVQCLLGEAILLYVAPQLDGLDRADIVEIYRYFLKGFFTAEPLPQSVAFAQGHVLERIKSLYPHIRSDEWPNE
ncbi:MAG TPA: hypothetical protein VII92_01035, partial [Anaerolineae bacterium]